jgi:hypothetical protein
LLPRPGRTKGAPAQPALNRSTTAAAPLLPLRASHIERLSTGGKQFIGSFVNIRIIPA